VARDAARRDRDRGGAQAMTVGRAAPSPAAPAVDPRPGWALCFALALALYAATASRGVQWADSTHIMDRIVKGDLVGHLGLALSHPLHHWLGRLAVLIGGPEPVVITWVSSFFGALTIANVYGCVVALVARRGPAFFAAASLALATTFWRVSTITEVYTVSAALMAATCWCLILFVRDGRARDFWLACLWNGLGGANDLQSGLTTLVLVGLMLVFVRTGRLTVRQGLVAALVWLAAIMPYGALVIREWIDSGDLGETVRSALFGKLWSDAVLSRSISRRVLIVDVVYPIMNFLNLLLPAAAYGLYRARSAGVPAATFWGLVAMLGIHAGFSLRYDIVEQYNFFIPMYVLFALFGGVGAHAALQRFPGRRALVGLAIAMIVLTPASYVAATALARSVDALRGFARNKPYRDDYVYLMIPWSVVEDSAERMARHTLELAGADGLVVAEDRMALYGVAYRAMLDGRTAPAMVPEQAPDRAERIAAAVGAGRAVVLIPWNREAPRTPAVGGAWRRVGDLYVLAPIVGTAEVATGTIDFIDAGDAKDARKTGDPGETAGLSRR